MSDKYLTVRELMKLLGVSYNTLWRYRVNGNGPPFINHSGRILYERKSFNKWISAHTYTSTAEYRKKNKIKRRKSRR
jgi:predicted site-specific integrase-resolvase